MVFIVIAATLIDDRGRVGGRINVVDLAAAIVVLALVPLAFAAYALFRTPAPTLSRITPATLFQGQPQRIEIDGTNLRPFMRVSIDTVPARSFLLGSTKYAIVDLPDLRPGSYDVVLYDYMQEVARLRNALTVAPVPTDVELDVDGAFTTLTDTAAAGVRAIRRRVGAPGRASLGSGVAEPARIPKGPRRSRANGSPSRC